jgi:hypothetical protein
MRAAAVAIELDCSCEIDLSSSCSVRELMEVLHAGDLVVNVGYRCFCSFGVRFIFVRRVDFHRLGSFMHCHAVKITREVFGPFRLFQTRRRESQSCGMMSFSNRKRAKLSAAPSKKQEIITYSWVHTRCCYFDVTMM